MPGRQQTCAFGFRMTVSLGNASRKPIGLTNECITGQHLELETNEGIPVPQNGAWVDVTPFTETKDGFLKKRMTSIQVENYKLVF